MTSQLKIAAIVLAAGQSRRMGPVNKLLMEIEGVPMVERVLLAIQAAGVEKTIVVTGFESDRIEERLSGYDVEFVWNENFEAGMGSSLAGGAAALAENRFDGILVCLGDLPYLKKDSIGKVIDAFKKAKGEKIVAPCFEGKRGHPVIFPSHYKKPLEGLQGDAGARALIQQEAQNLLELDLSEEGTIRDMDTADA
jgi:molybdenum cofactor cytidylyltransferase|tara:strand:+ start:1758 stop:2342 length:585 start_codon:yes stop_codon:yes gene_type:complete